MHLKPQHPTFAMKGNHQTTPVGLNATLFLKPVEQTASPEDTCHHPLLDFASTYKQAGYTDGKTSATMSPGP